MLPLFTIIIATCDRPQRLLKTLDSVRKAIEFASGEHRLIVVDNGLEYSAYRVVADFRKHVGFPATYLRSSPRNKAVALNAGIVVADTEWLAFTDDDCLVDNEWLRSAVGFAVVSGVRVFAGHIEPAFDRNSLPKSVQPFRSGGLPGGGIFVRYCPMRHSGILPDSAPGPLGANIFVKRDVFRTYGGYDEELWRLCGKAALGSEDGEFGVRMIQAREPIGYCHEALVIHPVHGDKFPLLRRLQHGYRIGWRSPLVLYETGCPLIELYRFGILGRQLSRALGRALRGTRSDFFGSLVNLSKTVGSILCRFSCAYRRRVAMEQQRLKNKEHRAQHAE